MHFYCVGFKTVFFEADQQPSCRTSSVALSLPFQWEHSSLLDVQYSLPTRARKAGVAAASMHLPPSGNMYMVFSFGGQAWEKEASELPERPPVFCQQVVCERGSQPGSSLAFCRCGKILTEKESLLVNVSPAGVVLLPAAGQHHSILAFFFSAEGRVEAAFPASEQTIMLDFTPVDSLDPKLCQREKERERRWGKSWTSGPVGGEFIFTTHPSWLLVGGRRIRAPLRSCRQRGIFFCFQAVIKHSICRELASQLWSSHAKCVVYDCWIAV